MSDYIFDYKQIDLLLKKQIRFALYRLPGQKNLNLVLQKGHINKTVKTVGGLNNQEGFLIMPFEITELSPFVIIRPDIVLDNSEDIFRYIANENSSGSIQRDYTDQRVTLVDEKNFKVYEQDYIKFQTALDQGAFDKLVLSRSERYDYNSRFSIGLVFVEALRKYNDAFVYLTHTNESGTWLGCSPELLLSGHNNDWHTVALAGTKPLLDDDVIKWDPKNKQEQQIVVNYIKDQLRLLDIEFNNSDAQTVKAGNIIHLKTDFYFNLENVNLGDLLNTLHPTPAVCGFPKKEAIRFIKENESCDRKYYSGFTGPFNINNRTDLYVNLRCMEATTESLKFYGGGGILKSSNVITEWLETESKLQTLLSLIEI